MRGDGEVHRRVVMLSLAAWAVLAGCAAEELPREPLTLEQLLAEVLPEAEERLRRGAEDEPRYLRKLASLAARDGWVDELPRGVGPGIVVERRPVVVALIEIPRGDEIPLHDHAGYSAALRALAGRPTLRAYDLAGDEHPRTDRVLLAPRPEIVLAPGDVATAGTTEANVHGLTSSEGDALLVDVFTLHAPRPSSRRVHLEGDGPGATRIARRGTVL